MAELAATEGPLFGIHFWHAFSKAEWSRALDWLDLSGLALYFWQKMKSTTAGEALPISVQARLARCHEENCARVIAIKKEFATLNRLFEDGGVEYAVLKGFALIPDYCSDLSLRTQYDHDYLIRPGTLARAEEVLRKAGYRRKPSREGYHITYFRPASDVIASGRPVGLYSAGLGRPIELHLRLWDHAEEKVSVELPEDFLDRITKHSSLGLEYPALSEEDRLIFQVLHAFRHVLRNWCRLSVFLEISHLIQARASDSDFWFRYGERIRNMRWLPEASTVIFMLAENLFGGSVPAQVLSQVPPAFSSIVDVWIERYGLKAALENFRDSKYSLFLHREFVDDNAEWAEVLKRRLFPVHRPHQLPNVLSNPALGGLGRILDRLMHAFRRLRFHAFAAFAYVWEYPRWQVARDARCHGHPRTGASVQEEPTLRDRDPSPLDKPFSAHGKTVLTLED